MQYYHRAAVTRTSFHKCLKFNCNAVKMLFYNCHFHTVFLYFTFACLSTEIHFEKHIGSLLKHDLWYHLSTYHSLFILPATLFFWPTKHLVPPQSKHFLIYFYYYFSDKEQYFSWPVINHKAKENLLAI